MKVLVTGGRFWNLLPETNTFMDLVHHEIGITLLIHGAAVGADTLCADWAVSRGVPVLAFPILKSDWARYGKAAGVIRNQQMLDQGHPDLLVAFPGGSGTRDMVVRSKRRGLEIIYYETIATP